MAYNKTKHLDAAQKYLQQGKIAAGHRRIPANPEE